MHSQNGWPVVDRSATVDLVVHGVNFPNGVLRGDVATVLGWVAEQWHTRVMPLHVGWCWGWLVKVIEGSTTISNHASATAIDLDAPELPMGTPASRNMSAAQIEECHAIERESGGVVRWGGDFSRPDPMHWEINGTPEQVAAFAATLRQPPRIIARPDTTEEIMAALPTLKSGASNGWVRRAQALCNLVSHTGDDITVDGDYGAVTTAKVKSVQRVGAVKVTGVIDVQTWAVLLGVR